MSPESTEKRNIKLLEWLGCTTIICKSFLFKTEHSCGNKGSFANAPALLLLSNLTKNLKCIESARKNDHLRRSNVHSGWSMNNFD